MQNTTNTLDQCPAVPGQESTVNQRSRGKWTKLAKLAFLGILAASLSGCDPGEYTGGGFINSAAGGKAKATFGFNLEALDRDGDGQSDELFQPVFIDGELAYYRVWSLAKGQFNYNDPAAGVSFHMDVNETLALDENGNVDGEVFWNGFLRDGALDDGFVTPDEIILTSMVFYGPYASNAGSGRVSVTLTAKGDSFGGAEDTIEVSVSGGPYDGYHNSGTIKGGNLQWHPAKSK